MKLKSIIICLLFMNVLIWGQTVKKEINIAIIKDGETEYDGPYLKLFKDEIHQLLQNEYSIIFQEKFIFDGQFSKDIIQQSITQANQMKEIDIILALGFLSSQSLIKVEQLNKPAIASIVMDENLQGFKNVKQENLNYILSVPTFEMSLLEFGKIVPLKKITILISDYYYNYCEETKQKLKNTLSSRNLEYNLVSVGETIEGINDQIPPDVDGVFILPLTRLKSSQLKALVQRINEKKLPTFSHYGEEELYEGVLATISGKENMKRLARRTALNIQRILWGEKPGDLPSSFHIDAELTINMETARKISVFPNWEVITEAKLLKTERTEVTRNLDLKAAIKEALEVNPDYREKQASLKENAMEIKKAWSNLLPQVSAQASYTQVDENLAENSMGSQAEKTIQSSVNSSQVILSEKAMANLSIQKKLKKAKEKETLSFERGVVLQVLSAYMNVLKANNYENIQKENLKKTESNSDLAQIRVNIGSSNPAELFRWESELATVRQSLIEANARRNIAEMDLNRLLNRPLEEHFSLREINTKNPLLLTSNPFFNSVLKNPYTFKQFRDFLEEYGVEHSPDLKNLNIMIEVEKRSIASVQREFFLPQIGGFFNFNYTIDRQGTGSDGMDLSSVPEQYTPFLSFLKKEQKDDHWNFGVQASLPLFNGGERFFRLIKEKTILEELKLRKESLKKKIGQKIRTNAHILGASHSRIRYSREAAQAAEKTLDLITDSYAKGVVSIIDLIDAQNKFILAKQANINAHYDFIIDLLSIQDDIGLGYYQNEEENISRFFLEFKEYLNKTP